MSEALQPLRPEQIEDLSHGLQQYLLAAKGCDKFKATPSDYCLLKASISILEIVLGQRPVPAGLAPFSALGPVRKEPPADER